MLHPISDTTVRGPADLSQPDQDLNPPECPDIEDTRSFEFKVEDRGFLDLINDLFNGEWF